MTLNELENLVRKVCVSSSLTFKLNPTTYKYRWIQMYVKDVGLVDLHIWKLEGHRNLLYPSRFFIEMESHEGTFDDFQELPTYQERRDVLCNTSEKKMLSVLGGMLNKIKERY